MTDGIVLLDRVMHLLNVHGVDAVVVKVDDWRRVDLPLPPGADFSLSAYLFADQDAQIGANRVGGTEDEYYFYRAYEVAGYSSIEELRERYLSDLEILISNPIQIHQTHGWLWEDFYATITIDGKEKRFGGNTGLRLGGCKPPPISGKQAIYHSPAIVHTGNN